MCVRDSFLLQGSGKASLIFLSEARADCFWLGRTRPYLPHFQHTSEPELLSEHGAIDSADQCSSCWQPDPWKMTLLPITRPSRHWPWLMQMKKESPLWVVSKLLIVLPPPKQRHYCRESFTLSSSSVSSVNPVTSAATSTEKSAQNSPLPIFHTWFFLIRITCWEFMQDGAEIVPHFCW